MAKVPSDQARFRFADRLKRPARAALVLFVVLAAACDREPFTLSASGPLAYTGSVESRLGRVSRVAVLVTITNHTEDDLQVGPADFSARDSDHRLYPASPTAALADARFVRVAGVGLGLGDLLPLPVITLRKDDVISGFVVFDVPAGVWPAELVWRQSDGDRVVELTAPAP